jgi:hypothetical protein
MNVERESDAITIPSSTTTAPIKVPPNRIAGCRAGNSGKIVRIRNTRHRIIPFVHSGQRTRNGADFSAARYAGE